MKNYLNNQQAQGRASTLSIMIIIMFYCLLKLNWLGLILNLGWFIVVCCFFAKMKNNNKTSTSNLMKIHIISLIGAISLLCFSMI